MNIFWIFYCVLLPSIYSTAPLEFLKKLDIKGENLKNLLQPFTAEDLYKQRVDVEPFLKLRILLYSDFASVAIILQHDNFCSKLENVDLGILPNSCSGRMVLRDCVEICKACASKSTNLQASCEIAKPLKEKLDRKELKRINKLKKLRKRSSLKFSGDNLSTTPLNFNEKEVNPSDLNQIENASDDSQYRENQADFSISNSAESQPVVSNVSHTEDHSNVSTINSGDDQQQPSSNCSLL